MFTGLIETLGTVQRLEHEGAGTRLVVTAPSIASQLAIGESVAVNGVCLTVVQRSEEAFAFQAGPETLQRTNLGQLHPGEPVNLERALRVGERLGGHLVQGHVDGCGTVASRQRSGEWEIVCFACALELAAQMVAKGSVAVDGVSLTVVEAQPAGFSVALIPHTLSATTLGRKAVGATVNLETDVLAKYVWKCVEALRGGLRM
jgi:riboflavin synthase